MTTNLYFELLRFMCIILFRYVLNDGVLQDKINCSSILQSVEEHIQVHRSVIL